MGGIAAGPGLEQHEAMALNRAIWRYRGINTKGDLEKARSGDLWVRTRHIRACAKPLWRKAQEKPGREANCAWTIKCRGCQALNVLQGKPRPLSHGWQRHRCTGCRAEHRLGQAFLCVACNDMIAACGCECVGGRQPPALSARGQRLLQALRTGQEAAEAAAGR